MAALDFPDAPTNGQVYDKWTWNGTQWVLTPATTNPPRTAGYAQIVANVAGVTTLADITGLTVTFTATISRRYKVTGEIMASQAAGATTELGQMRVADGAGTMKQAGNYPMPAAATNYKMHIEFVAVAAATGSQTYKLQYQRAAGAGTHTIIADPAIPAFILVEDIT